jgi:SAM-dependent methyltransferase/FKBP-type peptidyl-prolyl cis-trans isomerase 2
MNNMKTTTKNSVAGVEFRFSWNSEIGSHKECRYVENVNFWRDVFPETFYKKLLDKAPKDEISHVFRPGELIPGVDESLVLKVKNSQVDKDMNLSTRYGRYYPKGMLKGITRVFKVNREPFRCLRSDGNEIHADMNHPLAGRDISVHAAIDIIESKSSERGGSCMALQDLIYNGPGMQTRCNGHPTDFFSDDAFARVDESDDGVFYTPPRLVNHLDDMAIGVLSGMYGQLIRPGSKVLDLMSSWKSHLPVELELDSVTGLGMNRIELEANTQLTAGVLHDLNSNPSLPFDDNQFDAVLCTVSVEYLVKPFDVFADVARVLKPGGLFIVSFSNRWFPPKAIRIWKELHEFERMGLVAEYFLQSKMFSNLHTWSMRGKPRPYDDKYFGLNMMLSDPVYMVWATKGG